MSDDGDEPPRIVASFNSYEGMLEALRTRVSELQISGERFDEFAGLPRGYLSKLEHVPPRLNRGILMRRRMGESIVIDSLLGAGQCRGLIPETCVSE